jgi:hypothetical protein
LLSDKVNQEGESTRDDDNDSSSGKFITTFSDSGKKPKRAADDESSDGSTGSKFIESSEKGRYALISALGFGIIALIFFFIIPNRWEIIVLSLVAMAFLGAKAFFLAYPKISLVRSTNTIVKSYFLTGIFIMAWIIFMGWSFQYLMDAEDVTDNATLDFINMVGLSILSSVSVFFITMTKARR